MVFREMDKAELEAALKTNAKRGLDEEEVERRLQESGLNELQEGEKKSALLMFFSQFKDFMILVLLAATLISGLLGEYIDAIAIIAIVIINAVMGFVQEHKAEKSLDALKEMSAPQVNALREGNWTKIASKQVVVGDVLKFSTGDRIGADLRIIDASSLEIEESALTGESIAVNKTGSSVFHHVNSIGDEENMAFMGTMVARGNGVGIVTATGMNTEMGQIADMLQSAKAMITPLQHRLEQLGKILIVVAILLTILVIGLGVFQGNNLYTMVLAGVSLAVAAIPEGLPAIVTVALSLGVQRMIKQRAIVRKLPAVETLGCASVICSDKTGTLTQNKMTVTTVWDSGHTWHIDGKGNEASGSFSKNGQAVKEISKSMQQLLTFGLLCNTSEVREVEGQLIVEGSATEGAMQVAAMKAGITKAQLLQQFSIEKEYPFDSSRKMMSVIVKDGNGQYFVVTKGAPDVLLGKCKSILWDERAMTMDSRSVDSIQNAIDDLASQALRTIAIGYKKVTSSSVTMHEREIERDLTFIGLQGIIDPPRPEVKDAVSECHKAGIKTIMITGDHVATAKAIAKQLGILQKDDIVIEGRELNDMSLEDLEEVVEHVAVFARVSPEHKLKIVKALQNKGHVVAMTGDGVNDAPAIKAADIGVAMGITGTDVSKEASALVLLDDNFATIKSAIKEGRNIYENIRKFIRYLLASNVGEILVMLFAMLLALPLPLTAIQILWVNLVTDGLPAMALGLDQPEDNVMKRKPRHPKEGVFSRGLGWKIVSRGFLIGGATLLAFMTALHNNPGNLAYAQTIAFVTLVLAQLIHVFDCRSEKNIFARNPFGNKYLVGAVLLSLLMIIPVIYIPALQGIFGTVAIIPKDWLLVLGMSAIPTFLLAGSFFIRKTQ
ncbi:cation-translocating P-type ATPase [Bacillus massiliigorillae]|uniref:cation-translocating P-type ATPase n=1 Tax=Bacillus massiliigorillae TaxID=1243664 RepID=UPI0003A8962D|nr:cation-translocating P-type ATPase [Bacillus massiliigorillae]